jgi:hypothetical protein
MATYHLSAKIGQKGKAQAHAAYIAREGKYSEGKRYEDLEATGSGNMPKWAEHKPAEFWKAADEYERANGSAYREFEIALPRELTPEQRLNLVQEFIVQEIGDKHAYQFAIHTPKAALEKGEQPHAHIMYSERIRDRIDRDPAQYFKRYNAKNPEKGGSKKFSGGKSPSELKEELLAQRERWATLQNAHLEKTGHSARVDHRSLLEQGITDRQSERHLGGSGVRNTNAKNKLLELRIATAENTQSQTEAHQIIESIRKQKAAEARVKADLDERAFLAEVEARMMTRALERFKHNEHKEKVVSLPVVDEIPKPITATPKTQLINSIESIVQRELLNQAKTELIPQEVANKYVRDGNNFLHRRNQEVVMFEDKFSKLETKLNSQNIAIDLVKIATERGWQEIKITGTPEFKREVWLEAETRGLKTIGYQPTDFDKAILNVRIGKEEVKQPQQELAQKISEQQEKRANEVFLEISNQIRDHWREVESERLFSEVREMLAQSKKLKEQEPKWLLGINQKKWQAWADSCNDLKTRHDETRAEANLIKEGKSQKEQAVNPQIEQAATKKLQELHPELYQALVDKSAWEQAQAEELKRQQELQRNARIKELEQATQAAKQRKSDKGEDIEL